MSLSQKLKTTGSTDQGNHRNRLPGSPRFGHRQDARHWNITKIKFYFRNTYPTSSHKNKVNAEQRTLYSSTTTKVDMPHGTQGTCV